MSITTNSPCDLTQLHPADFDDIDLLHEISVTLIAEQDSRVLYGKIVYAAVAITGSQFGTMQVLTPEADLSGHAGHLNLLASHGLDQEALGFWQWVNPAAYSSCTQALKTGGRAIIRDFEEWDDIAGTEDLSAFRRAGIRSAQTTPLISRRGKLIGMLSTHWSEPHEPSRRDLRLLDILARQAADLLERTISEEALRAREAAARESERQFRSVADSILQLAWTCDERGLPTWYNQRWVDYTGIELEKMQGAGWAHAQHPDHLERVAEGFGQAQKSGVIWEDTFPLRGADGEFRWFLSRAVPIHDATGAIVQWFGTNTDITQRIRAEELQKILTGELSHRVKNMLATVQAVATQTQRHSKTPKEFVTGFNGRIQSMARVHSQLSENEWTGAQLREVVREQLKMGAVDETRVSTSGPEVHLASDVVPSIAMMLHELGTNSIKYGALSKSSGSVSINWRLSGHTLHFSWSESGGPTVKAPVRRGFGSSLIERSAMGSGGSATMFVEVTGVRWEIEFPIPKSDAPTAITLDARAINHTDNEFMGVVRGSEVKKRLLDGKRILIVEDEPLVAMDLADQLESEGAIIIGPAATVDKALDLVDREVFDAALLDANLSGARVDDIAAALTRNNVPFAFVSGYGRDALPQSFASVEVLSKPFGANQLLAITSKLISHRSELARRSATI